MKKEGKPLWYFGWNIVAASAFLTMMTTGMRMGIGPFLLPMIKDLGFSRTLLSGIIAIGMLFYGIGMPIAGYLVVRKGTRFVLLLGTTIIFLAAIWTVLARDPISFLLAYGIAFSIGSAFTSPVAFSFIVSRWFTRRRGMALFFLSTGSMAGIAILTPLFTYTIAHFSWQSTLIGYALFFVILTIPIAFLIMRENPPYHTDLPPKEGKESIEQKPIHNKQFNQQKRGDTKSTVPNAIKTLPFWLICIGTFVCGFSMNLLGTHGVPMLVDHGFTNETSAFGIGLIGLTAIFSTIILGRIADNLEQRYLLIIIYLVRGIGFFALVLVSTSWQLYSVAIICGLAWAGNMALSSTILANLYGVHIVGILYGWAFLGHQMGAMTATWLGGWAYEQYHTHWIAFGLTGFLLMIAALISYFLPKRL